MQKLQKLGEQAEGAKAAPTTEDAMQIVEQMTKEKTETLASLEDPKQTNEKLQNELDTLKENNLKNVEELNKAKELLIVENQKIEEFKKEMETLKQAAAQKSQQLSALQEENVKLNEELGRSRDKVTSHQKLEEERPVLNNQLLEMKKSDDQEKQSKKKPCLFCDICDCFGLHDTEDCPTQAQMSEDPPHSTHHSSRSEERPYCEICEMFGHWTTDCNDDETF